MMFSVGLCCWKHDLHNSFLKQTFKTKISWKIPQSVPMDPQVFPWLPRWGCPASKLPGIPVDPTKYSYRSPSIPMDPQVFPWLLKLSVGCPSVVRRSSALVVRRLSVGCPSVIRRLSIVGSGSTSSCISLCLVGVDAGIILLYFGQH